MKFRFIVEEIRSNEFFELNNRQKFKLLGDAFLFCLAAMFISVIIWDIISWLSGSEFNQSNNSYNTAVKNWILVVLLAPVVEEIGFRLFLKPNKLKVWVSIFVLCYFIFSIVTVSNFYSELDTLTLYKLLAALGVSSLITFLFSEKIVSNIKSSLFQYYIFSSFLFGLLHLLNFVPLDGIQIILFPFLILPQILFGFAFGYLRLKNGLTWAIGLHALINSISFIFKSL
ncbi:CPBP family intramembrane glutamic endopeptidase [Marivirga sp.]|uniref:CPBP family intramembrane glutamic endopeptidase n=1 Tax=Marivirga sp. TaxID=2018662 RepID=UPI002D7E5D7B|nr:CPBP family intramembrane glutamic endopeptidase [Marivirga sp.]HET8861209.1 CPBP family intramembrane glutamic endopeptidase [Marivirga sp.]